MVGFTSSRLGAAGLSRSTNWAIAAGRELWRRTTRTLGGRMICAFLAVSLLPLSLIAYFDHAVTRAALTEAAYRSLFAAASQMAARLDAFAEDNSTVVGTEAKVPLMAEFLSLSAAEQKQATPRMLSLLQAFAQKDPAFIASYGLLDLTGHNVIDTDPANIGADESGTRHFREALESGLPHASPVEFSVPDGKAYLSFSSTVTTPAGQPVGVLRQRYSAAILQQLVSQSTGLVGPLSFAMVLNQDGLLVAHGLAPPSRIGETLFRLGRPMDDARIAELQRQRLLPLRPAEDMFMHLPGLAAALENAGETTPFFTAIMPIAGDRMAAAAVTRMATQPWLVVMLQPQDVFLAPIEAQARNAFLLALAIVSLAVAAAIGVARLLTGPIVRLTELARRVAEGDLSAKVDVWSDDEIGVLASAFNLMTAKLKKTLDGLRRSEEDYRGIYENAIEGIWRISIDGRSISANPAMAGILGYSSPEDLIANVTDIARQIYVDPEHRDTVILADLARGPIIGREVEFHRKDRRRIWISFSGRLVRSKTGKPLFIESFVTDITERKQMETALRESEQRFRDYAQTASDWFWETGPDHRFTFVSERLVPPGANPSDVIGKLRWELAADLEDEPDKWQAHFVALERREPFREFTYRNRARSDDGSPRYFAVSGTPMFDHEGRFLGYRGSGREVTHAVLSARALQEAKDQAEAASRAKSQFLANMSHELRTPLNAIIGMSEMMKAEMLGPLGNDKYRGYSADIHQSGLHLLEIINDLLDLARIEAGKADLEEHAVALEGTVTQVLKMAAPQAAEAGLTIRRDIDPKLPQVRANEKAIRQILLNLVSNAIKFTPPGGSVTVGLGRAATGGVRMWVADTGIGIAPQHIPELMRPFTQLDNVYQRKYQGAGLGLALIRSLTEQHGGSVEIESALGRGTTVTVLLPADRVLATDESV